MTARRKPSLPELVEEPPESPSDITQLDRDAQELNHLVTQGSFRLGLICARCVFIGEHGGDRSSSHVNLNKVSVSEFAAKSGVSESKIRQYYRAWELAAETGVCAKPSELAPGQEDTGGIGQWEDTDEDEEQRQKWSYWLGKARKPKKEQDSEPIPVEEEIDDDFGTTVVEDSITEDEATEADSAIVRNELLEILESTRALTSKLAQVNSVVPEVNELLLQISSAALDLNTTANALSVQAQDVTQ